MATTAHKFELIIQAAASQAVAEVKKTASAIQDGFTRGKLAVAAFNKTVSESGSPVSSLTGHIRNLVGAAIGLSALAKAVKTLQDAESAAFNMATSVQAANREFDNTGSLASWEASIKRLSDELKIYSESSLKNAVARTVDMTKRLGLSAEQMEEVIKRSADLGAGKTDLEGAIERVTAALRGEAEASEYLGLTLNENYVKAWYEASDAQAKAWKDLSDLEKAQVRYNAFLAQSDQLQGRAAASAETFGGAMAMVRKEIEDAIVNNRDVAASMSELADVLRDHAGEIGEIASDLLSGAAAAIEFAVEYKEMLAVIAGTAVAATLVGKLVTVVTALNAAWAVMTGMTVVQWLASLRLALVGVTAQMTLMSLAFKGFIAFAAAQGLYNIARLAKALWDLRDANRELAEAQDELASQKAWIDPQIAAKLKEISDQTGIAIKSFERFAELRKKGVIGYDPSTGKYFKEKETPKPSGTGSGGATDSEQKKIAADQVNLERQLALELLNIAGAKWEAMKEQATQHYEDQLAQAHGNAQLIAQAEALYQQTLADIDARAAKESSDAWMKNAVARMQAHVETSIAVLEDAYQRGEMAIGDYFDRRKTLIEQRAEDEIEVLRGMVEAESDAGEKLRIDTEIYEKEQALYRDLLALARERADAEKAIADAKRQTNQILDDLRLRTLPRDGGRAEYVIELAELDRRHQEEIRRLHDLRAAEDQINDAYRMQQLEKDQLLADQEQRIFESRLQNASDIFGGMADVFTNLYHLGGESQKEWFYLAKAAALAEAIVNTALAVTKALSEGGPFAGPALAAVAAASGAVQIATIASQTLASGGPVRGSSPNDRADNIPIWATANEFMQPVPTVKYYTFEGMEAIRKRLIPRDVILSYARGLTAPRPAYALASGGPVPEVPGMPDMQQAIANKVNIVNFIDPSELRRYLQSEEGSRAILNVVSSRPRQFARRMSR